MVTPVTGAGFNAADYLSQIKGIKPTTPISSGSGSSSSSGSSSTNSGSSSTTSSSNALGISSEVLTLLQGIHGSSGVNTLSDLFGSISSGTSNQLFKQASTAPIENAINTLKQQKANLKAQASTLDSVLSSRNGAINAYNKTLLENAKAAVKANDGQLPTSA